MARDGSVDLSSTAADLRLAVKLLAQRLRAEARPGVLSWSQESVVSLLDRHNSMTITELAKAEGVRTQSVGATVTSLEVQGLVRREADPTDGRQVCLSLTDKGNKALAEAREIKQNWLIGIMGERLSLAEQKRLAAAVGLLLRLV